MARQREHGQVRVGDQAPDFTLTAHTGEHIRLYDLVRKGPVVLYFYPKDNTSGCTAEACAFRDSYSAFAEAGAQVVGVSSDPVDSHARFAARHHLPFLLLSDPGGSVRKLYGVAPTLGILPGRATFVIDGQGTVRHTFSSQFAATQHVQEAMATLRALMPSRQG